MPRKDIPEAAMKRQKERYKRDADPIDKDILDNPDQIGHSWIELKEFYVEEERLKIIDFGPLKDANVDTDLIKRMTNRWNARREACKLKRKIEEHLGPVPKLVGVLQMDPEQGLYPDEPCIETTNGTSVDTEIESDYVRFVPPDKIKEGNSSMADNWDRYVRAGQHWAEWGHRLEDKERTLWKKYAGNLSTTTSTSLPGNNKLAKQKGPSEGAWALWTLLKVVYGQKEMMGKSVALTVQKRYPRADLAKWPLNEDGPTRDLAFREIWDADRALKNPSTTNNNISRPRKKQKTGNEADTNTNQPADNNTDVLDSPRNTVAGSTVKKFLVEKLIKDVAFLKHANVTLTHNVSSLISKEAETRVKMQKQIDSLQTEVDRLSRGGRVKDE